MKRVSASTLSEKLGVSKKEMFDKLVELEFIYRKEGKWCISDLGKEVGGLITANDKYGEYITWPEDFNPFINKVVKKNAYLNATKIGETFEISNQRVNNILSELGWIEQAIKGWKITFLGNKLGGLQKEHQSGATYVIWPDSILQNPTFLRSFKPMEFLQIDKSNTVKSEDNMPNKYPDSLLKTKDGHLVRSRAELIIDNLLYDYGLTHAYERELTVAETVLSDFYIPARNGGKAVYIEFWGITDNVKYLERKKFKQEIYKTNNLNLIELDDKHLDNLDSYLRKTLLKYNINVE